MAVFQKKGKKTMKLEEVTSLLNELRIPTALVTTPTNLNQEKKKFFQSDSYNPFFEYKIVKNPNNSVFGELRSLETITDVDPRISRFYIRLIEAKKGADELMNSVGNNVKFSKVGIQRFKLPSPILFRNSARVLRGLVKNYNIAEDKRTDRKLNYDEVGEVVMDIFKEYGLDNWKVNSSINIAKNGMKVGIKKRELLMDRNISSSPQDVKRSIVHEMVHIIRAVNGMNTGFEALMKPNLPRYLDVEEGLATWNVEQMGLMTYKDLKKRAGKVWAIHIGTEMSFRELYNATLAFLPKYAAFDLVYRIKRGLGDTSMPGINPKDVVYFRGYRLLRKKSKNDPTSIGKLYAGKISFSQIKWVDEGLIPKPKIVPNKDIYDKVFNKYSL